MEREKGERRRKKEGRNGGREKRRESWREGGGERGEGDREGRKVDPYITHARLLGMDQLPDT